MERVHFNITLGSCEFASIYFEDVPEVNAMFIVLCLETFFLLGYLAVKFIQLLKALSGALDLLVSS